MRHTLYCALCLIATVALGLLSMRYLTRLWVLTFFTSAQTHIALFGMTLAALAFLLRRHWYPALLFVAAGALAIHSLLILREHAAPAAAETAASFRLLSFNIDNENRKDPAHIADAILGSQADVVAIYEAVTLLPEMDRLAKAYPYRIGCGVMSQDCDSLVMSKRPFLTAEMRDLGMIWRNRLIVSAVDIGGKPVTFVSAHLSKPYFDAFHRDELVVLRNVFRDIDGAAILSGDFNASVLPPDMRAFLTRSGLQHASSEPATWPIAAGDFGIAIDHIFVRPPVEIVAVRRLPDSLGSNHYGLIADFGLR